MEKRPELHQKKIDAIYALIDVGEIEKAKKQLLALKEDMGEQDTEIHRLTTQIEIME